LEDCLQVIHEELLKKKKNKRQGRRDQGEGGAGIGAVEEANKVEIREVDETNDMDVEME
jgi:hypothetical protein